ncbi:MAG: hypothetical protein HY908_07585 [Myxococcales bacterium]|nr:hypothetical protein [Myxococcales bacterium]
MSTTERRTKRSNVPGLALQHWLAAVAEREGLFGLVLADDSGLLIGASLPDAEAAELAALAPGLAPPTDDGARLDKWYQTQMLIEPVEIDRSRLWLWALGDRARGRASLPVAARGVRRILAAA